MTSTSGFRDGGKQNICRNRKNIERASRERQKALYEQPGRPSPSLIWGRSSSASGAGRCNLEVLRCGQILKHRACGYTAIKGTKMPKMTLNPQILIN